MSKCSIFLWFSLSYLSVWISSLFFFTILLQEEHVAIGLDFQSIHEPRIEIQVWNKPWICLIVTLVETIGWNEEVKSIISKGFHDGLSKETSNQVGIILSLLWIRSSSRFEMREEKVREMRVLEREHIMRGLERW